MSMKVNDVFVCGFQDDLFAKKVSEGLKGKFISIFNGKFNDGSSQVRCNIKDKYFFNDKTVHLVAGNSRGNNKSINDRTLEIGLAIDAIKHAGAKAIELHIPHLGYARQDKVSQPGEPSSAQLVLNMFQMAGVSKITTLDIHNDRVLESLKVPTINKLATSVFAKEFKRMKGLGEKLEGLVVVAPDHGAKQRALEFQKAMKVQGFANTAFAYFDKSRDNSVKGKVQTMVLHEYEVDGKILVGKDAEEAFKGKTVIVIDDMADTCGTLLKAISENIIGKYGAKQAYAAITHGVFSGDALKKIANAKGLKKLLVTNSIPLRVNPDSLPKNIQVVDCSSVFVESINGK